MLRASWIGGLLAAVIGLVGPLGHARAADDGVAAKTYAVLVGVSQYADPQIKLGRMTVSRRPRFSARCQSRCSASTLLRV